MMKYDAFISYRHGELDGLVAEKLHRMLETYRIPNHIAKKIGMKKLTRVFRDREELPTSSNLSDSINFALENSSFLLLICSKRTCQSKWVMREVERFGELHGKDRIVALLIDGEPDESFPPGLRERQVGGETIFVEPLAADIRADTWKGSLKLLKEEKLRLLSPILGCAFDDLRRRHRRRRIQRISTIVGAAFAFTLSFGAFSTYQYLQIDRQMQLKLENQSHVLSEYSANLAASGDPDTALLLALKALPENLLKPERPLVTAAKRALADALLVYDVSDGFRSHKALTLPAPPGKLLLSPGEQYLAALYPYELAVFDIESSESLIRLPAVQSTLAEVRFLNDDTVVFAGKDGLEAFNIADGKILWTGHPATSVTVSGDGSVIAAVYKDDSTAFLYTPDGEVLSTVDFGSKSMLIPVDDSFTHTDNTLFALNENGSLLAVSFSDGSLWLYDSVTKSETLVYPANGAIHFRGDFFGDILLYSLVEREPYNAVFALFNTVSNQHLRQLVSEVSRFIPYTGRAGGAFVAHEQMIYSLDPVSGEIMLQATANGRIASFSASGDTFLICENDGTYQFSFIEGDAQVFRSDYICHLAVLGSRYALTGSHDSTTVRVLKYIDLSHTEILSYDRSYLFSEAQINPENARAVFYSYRGMRVLDLEGNIKAETKFPDPELVRDTRYDKVSGNVAVIYDSSFRLYSGADASLLLEAQGRADVKSVYFANFGVTVLSDLGAASLYDLSTGEIIASVNDVQGDSALLFPPSGDGTPAFITSQSGDIIGAAKISEDTYAFAVSDGLRGRVYTIKNGVISDSERFSFPLHGSSEVFFSGDFVFVSPLNGDASAYSMDGELIRTFSKNGYFSEAGELGGYISADYISATDGRFTLLLKPDSLETVAVLKGFWGEMPVAGDAVMLVLDDLRGSLRAARLRSTTELIDMANERLGGRELTAEELIIYRAG